MTPKERVRAALSRQPVDRMPAHFQCTPFVMNALQERFGYANREEVYQRFAIDIRGVGPAYVGPERERRELEGRDYEVQGMFGEWKRSVCDGREYNAVTISHPLDGVESAEEVDAVMQWPQPEWFDYSVIPEHLDSIGDYASITGHWGPYQTTCDLRSNELLFMDMAMNVDLAKAIFAGMHDFQLWHYENILKAGEGRIDILRTHDDYGTQQCMLFSTDMWQDFFAEQTKALCDLAHGYGAFFQQHSRGAVRPIIPHLIDAGIDSLEPIQPVNGMDPEGLHNDFGDRLTFCGGIDTQHLLPNGTPDEVKAEVRRYIDTLGSEGGYILYPSQAWESCVPLDNIEAFYSVDRHVGAAAAV